MDDRRIFTVFEALKSGVTEDEIFSITRIDRWFLSKLKKLADYEKSIESGIDEEAFLKGKGFGYTSAALMRLSGAKTLPGRCILTRWSTLRRGI